jgi:hypothetical protein
MESQATVTPLSFRKIDFNRIVIAPLTPNESGKGLSGKIQYLNDKGVPENLILQSPELQFPYGVSNYLNENTNFSLSGSLDERVPILKEFTEFLRKFDEFTIQHAFKNAKTILGKNAEVVRDDGTKGPITLTGIRMFHNSLIKEPKPGYPATFKTTVYPHKDDKNVPIPETYNFKCIDPDRRPTSTNIPHHSVGCMHFQPATFYAVSGKYGITNVLKKVCLSVKGGFVEPEHVPNMYGEHPPLDIYDDAMEKAAQEAEKQKPRTDEVESHQEDTNTKPTKKTKNSKK